MEITPLSASDRQIIEAYGPTGFRISGSDFAGAAIVFPDMAVAWPVDSIAAITLESLAPVLGRVGTERAVEILLLGMGRQMRMLPPALRAELRGLGIAAETMDTGAACRTYDVLLAEGRRVAAALLPVT